MDEVTDDIQLHQLAYSPKLTHDKVMDLISKGRITDRWPQSNWDLLQNYMDIRELSKFSIPLNEMRIGIRVHRNVNLHDTPVNILLDMGLTKLIGANTPGLTLELARRLSIEPNYKILPLNDLCDLGLELIDMKSMPHVGRRFKSLHSLGCYATIVNCCKPMRIIREYMDLLIVTLC
jgi:hypothetical protein